jgi:hypothetical protein
LNILEKILAKASGLEEVIPGQIVDAKIDGAMVNDTELLGILPEN